MGKDFHGNDPRYLSYLLRTVSDDGSTASAVPGVNRNIPELQIVNERFDEELSDILEQAELDDQQQRALSRRFATE